MNKKYIYASICVKHFCKDSRQKKKKNGEWASQEWEKGISVFVLYTSNIFMFLKTIWRSCFYLQMYRNLPIYMSVFHMSLNLWAGVVAGRRCPLWDRWHVVMPARFTTRREILKTGLRSWGPPWTKWNEDSELSDLVSKLLCTYRFVGSRISRIIRTYAFSPVPSFWPALVKALGSIAAWGRS